MLRMNKIFVVLAAYLFQVQAIHPPAKSFTIGVRDTSLGLDGIETEWICPFNIEDYIVGFKNNGGVTNTLYAERSFVLPRDDGVISVHVDYDLLRQVCGVDSSWRSDKLGLEVSAIANTKDIVKDISFKATRAFGRSAVAVQGNFNPNNNHVLAAAKLSIEQTSGQITYDSGRNEAILSLCHNLDQLNSISPSFNLKTGSTKVVFTRKWDGGVLSSEFTPNEKVHVTWTDKSISGDWVTKVDIPLHESRKGTKISFSRNWVY